MAAKIYEIRARGQSQMNPSTLLRMWSAWGYDLTIMTSLKDVDELHILKISGDSGCWPTTVYKAMQLGYLYRPHKAHFRPTDRLINEIRKAQEIQKERRRNAS